MGLLCHYLCGNGFARYIILDENSLCYNFYTLSTKQCVELPRR
ncbi:hypothetical protein CFOL_v3_27457 [Cephalotus follicularis]|uniref:Uncharacterized protein n=1 Tax=Cephalotus follicularis TaxID=3775 RepID=A0A1Q3CUZ8_CEPFO|nr:hypothetical protein CFOL_v3_27457 [Cephalotus follicularis]